MVDPPDLGASTLQLPHGLLSPTTRRCHRRRNQQRLSSSKSSLILLLITVFAACLLGHVGGHVIPQASQRDVVIDDIASRAAAADSAIAARDIAVDAHRRTSTADTNHLEQDAALNKRDWLDVSTTSIPTSHTFWHRLLSQRRTGSNQYHQLHKRESKSVGEYVGLGILVPILVILSGIFAGLTLGYMSLDETQLHVLSTTGTEVQRARARKIIPIRKDGHLLLTTLLIANMITNETLPIIFDNLIPSPVGSVVASIVLIVIFAELIPQSTCSRYGLVIGAYMAFPTRIVILVLWPVAFPVSRILHWVLGPHHGIVYRRAELKELVAIHAASDGRGGDLKRDTVMIVGGALDLQEKVVRQAMTPIDDVFMLPFTAKLDYATLEKVVRSGHSRIPIYQDVEVPVTQQQGAKSGTATPTKRKLGPLLGPFTKKSTDDSNVNEDKATTTATTSTSNNGEDEKTTIKRRKIVGTLLVKSCVLLDPEDAVPVSSMVINALPTVPGDEPLLNVLNAFQEGRSHMAIVSARPRNRTMLGNDSIADLGSHANLYRSAQAPATAATTPQTSAAAAAAPGASAAPRVDGLGNIDEEKQVSFERSNSSSAGSGSDTTAGKDGNTTTKDTSNTPSKRSIWSRRLGLHHDDVQEQSIPSDATISDEKANAAAEAVNAKTGMASLTPVPSSTQRMSTSAEETYGWPLGIITLEDVLEELLGEEILDEYDDRGNEEQDFRTLNPPPSPEHMVAIRNHGDEKGVKPSVEEVIAATAAAGAATVEGEQGKDKIESSIPAQQQAQQHITLPPPAMSEDPTPTPKPTVLNRLGITRRRSTKQQQQPSSSDSEPPQVGAGVTRRRTETDFVSSSPVPAPAPTLVSSPIAADSGVTTSSPPMASADYFGGQTAAATAPSTRRPPRSSSVPAAAVPGSGYSSAGVTPAHSRPPSPSGMIASPPPPATATSNKLAGNRPVVIRTQDPSSGVQKTTIVTEGLLRGRQQSTSAAAVAAANANASVTSGSGAMTPTLSSSGLPSRSQTPAGDGIGSRGNRFKSQAAGGHLIGGQWITPQSSASGQVQPPQTQQQQTQTRKTSNPKTGTGRTALAGQGNSRQEDLSDSIGSLRPATGQTSEGDGDDQVDTTQSH